MYPARRILLVTLVTASCAAFAQRGDNDTGPADRCEATDCFNQLQIRNAEIVGQTSLIVFVGRQECPFLVELSGAYCDLTFAPGYDIVFRSARTTGDRIASGTGVRSPSSVIGSTRDIGGISGIGAGTGRGGPIEQTRICANDISMGLATNPFNTGIGGTDDDIDGLACRIRNVRSLTDDERLELYVDKEFTAPPPPFGTGRVEVPDSPVEPESAPAEADTRARRRRNDNSDD